MAQEETITRRSRERARGVNGSAQSSNDARAHACHSHGHLKLIWRENPHHLKVLEAAGMHSAGGEGEPKPLQTG
jgi:hypothetical protein